MTAGGWLQEWVEDWEPGRQGHNVSPDFPFYPGSSITLRGDPELARDRQLDGDPPSPRRLADRLGSRHVGTTRAG